MGMLLSLKPETFGAGSVPVPRPCGHAKIAPPAQRFTTHAKPGPLTARPLLRALTLATRLHAPHREFLGRGPGGLSQSDAGTDSAGARSCRRCRRGCARPCARPTLPPRRRRRQRRRTPQPRRPSAPSWPATARRSGSAPAPPAPSGQLRRRTGPVPLLSPQPFYGRAMRVRCGGRARLSAPASMRAALAVTAMLSAMTLQKGGEARLGAVHMPQRIWAGLGSSARPARKRRRTAPAAARRGAGAGCRRAASLQRRRRRLPGAPTVPLLCACSIMHHAQWDHRPNRGCTPWPAALECCGMVAWMDCVARRTGAGARRPAQRQHGAAPCSASGAKAKRKEVRMMTRTRCAPPERRPQPGLCACRCSYPAREQAPA